MRNKIIFVSLFIIVFILGLVSGIFYYKKYKAPVACWDQTKSRLANSDFVSPSVNQGEVKSVNGQITAINGNTITVKIKLFDLLSDPSLDTRTIEISDTTKIYQTQARTTTDSSNISNNAPIPTPDSKGCYQFSAPNGAQNTPPEAASQINEIKIGDIKVGDTVAVASENNIRDQKNINASSFVVILPASNK